MIEEIIMELYGECRALDIPIPHTRKLQEWLKPKLSQALETRNKELVEEIGKLQVMVGNLVYNHENENLSIGINQVLDELKNYRTLIQSK